MPRRIIGVHRQRHIARTCYGVHVAPHCHHLVFDRGQAAARVVATIGVDDAPFRQIEPRPLIGQRIELLAYIGNPIARPGGGR